MPSSIPAMKNDIQKYEGDEQVILYNIICIMAEVANGAGNSLGCILGSILA
jgi:hypothetical protein